MSGSLGTVKIQDLQMELVASHHARLWTEMSESIIVIIIVDQTAIFWISIAHYVISGHKVALRGKRNKMCIGIHPTSYVIRTVTE